MTGEAATAATGAPEWQGATAAPGSPTVVVLTPRWEATTEAGWITRQVAGALATVAAVHVVTPQGSAAGRRADSVFIVHETATPLDPTAELARDLLVEGVAATSPGELRPLAPDLGPLLDRGLIEPWARAADVVAGLRPDLVVVAGHASVGAVDAVASACPGVPLTLLALGADPTSLAFPHFDRVVARADAVLAVTAAEGDDLAAHPARTAPVHVVGAPMAANPSALGEPNPWVGDTGYLLVLTGTADENGTQAADLARLLRLRFPDRPVGVSASDKFSAWHQGRVNAGWPARRASDLSRLMAFAAVVVDLRPGPLFARRCVDSLLYGTPVVVPDGTRARQHAALGGGGLWFATPGELLWCVEALLPPEVGREFAAQGRAYAEERFGSTDRFIDRVVGAVGLGTDRVPGVAAAVAG